MTDKQHYHDTILLPKTDFPMRAGLPEQEPQWLARWAAMEKNGAKGLYAIQRQQKKGLAKFILHDGPPYANGHLHIGHALNKILKDLVVRSQNMLGKDAPYVPGWDCHGLPIEWKVEEDLRAKGINKSDIAVNEFRALCRDYANHWMAIQSEEFQRLGIGGDWQHPYNTMDFAAEAIIASEVLKVVDKDLLYTAHRPVMWSIPEQTALAEAEVEYKDITTRAIYVAFKLDYADDDVEIIIWTTTPWTIPANRAIAYSHNVDYGIYDIVDFNGKRRRVLLASALAGRVAEKCKWQSISMVEDKKYSSQAIKEKILVSGLSDHRAAMHPLYVMGDGADKKSGKINIGHADFVTADAGTGFVHIAPDHGKDDFNFYKTSVSVYDAAKVSEYVSSLSPYYVSKEGYYRRDSAIVEKITHDIPELEKEGVRIYDEQGKDGGANQAVIDALKRTNALVGIENYKHSYPHSWRSKAPVIFLATPQWFIEMDKSGDSPGDSLRQKSLAALQDVASYPANGKNTLTDMIANRPDWCISRQRTWGVPLPLFFYRDAIKTFILKDPTLVHKVKEVFTEQGADAWFDEEKYPDSFWLEGIKDDQGKAVDPNQWQKLKDVVDVWFDSGSTHGFVLEQRPELQSPADMYLEGIDQHRGWFHSSLLESVATRGRAPYKSLLTHGFVLDEKGNKMSKSLGNVVAPAEVIKQYGADILRLWVVASDYSENLLIGKNILAQHSESYRRVRNTFRWLLGVLNSSDKHFVAEGKQPEQMPAVDRYILHCLTELDIKIRAAITHYEFDKMFRALFTFCDSDLSAFYFDVRKDVLYCHAVDSVERRAAIFVIDTLHNCLCRWFAPILCFTAEEAWHTHPRHQQRHGDQDSIHLHDFPDITAHGWLDESLAKNIRTMIGVRKEVLQVLEQARKEKKIGSSLDAQIQLTLPADQWAVADGFIKKDRFDLAELFIVSSVALVKGDSLRVELLPITGNKCVRCWKTLPEVKDDICHRCHDVLGA